MPFDYSADAHGVVRLGSPGDADCYAGPGSGRDA
jgi:hypothetical protein